MSAIQTLLKPIQSLQRSVTKFLGRTDDPELARRLGFFGNFAKQNVTEDTALAIPAFDRAISIISQQIASIPFSVYNRDADGSITEQRSHPLHKILNYAPSTLYNSFVFREQMIRRLFLKGNVLIDIKRNDVGRVTELRIVDEAYDKFLVDGTVFFRISGDSKPRRYDEVIHLYINSRDDHYGRSIIRMHTDTLGRALSELYFAASYYSNGGQVSGVVESDKALDAKQLAELQQRIMDEYGGAENAGKIMALGHGFKYKAMGNKYEDSDTGARQQTIQDIANITGVPVRFLSGQQGGTYNNAEQDNRAFVQYTLRPICERIEAEFNAKLFSDRDLGNKFVQFDLSGLLRGDTAARVNYYRELYNIRAINPNEVRKIENIGAPYQGGDEYGLPLASNSKETINNGESSNTED